MKTDLAAKQLTLPLLPEGQFWRISRDIQTQDPIYGDYSYRNAEIFQVQLHQQRPWLFDRNRTVILDVENVYIKPSLAARGAEQAAELIIARRDRKGAARLQADALSGDYITVRR